LQSTGFFDIQNSKTEFPTMPYCGISFLGDPLPARAQRQHLEITSGLFPNSLNEFWFTTWANRVSSIITKGIPMGKIFSDFRLCLQMANLNNAFF